MSLRIRIVLSAAAALALGAPGSAPAQNRQLFGVVGPSFTISLTDATGAAVTKLDPGTYDIVVDDRAGDHNFHLSGPGVNQATEVAFIGKVTWTVTFVDGNYVFVCDPHDTQMNGSFVVGNPPPPPPPPPPRPPPPPTALARLLATVGPAATIRVRTPAGAVARSVKAGTVSIVVRDRSRIHNFHLTGPGVNRRTSVPFTGTQTWRLRLRRGLYRFVCDPHARAMKGSFRVT
jgi:plastocyanin